MHSDEVYFRDTAHGFIVWAVAFVATAAFLASASTALVGGENRNTSASGSETGVVDANRYFIDSLLRSAQPSGTPEEALRSEIGLIFAHSLRQRELSGSDMNYLADTVAARTGIPRPEAEQRVTDTFTRAQQGTDTARRAAAHSLVLAFCRFAVGRLCLQPGGNFRRQATRSGAHLTAVRDESILRRMPCAPYCFWYSEYRSQSLFWWVC